MTKAHTKLYRVYEKNPKPEAVFDQDTTEEDAKDVSDERTSKEATSEVEAL